MRDSPFRLLEPRDAEAFARGLDATVASPEDRAFRAFWHALLLHGPGYYAGNLGCRASVLRDNHVFLPVVITESDAGLSWVCSLKRYYVDVLGHYLGSRELTVRRRLLRKSLAAVTRLFRAAGLDRAVQVNNWMMSTSPVPPWLGPRLEPALRFLAARFPEHCIVLRSLNDLQHAALLQQLRELGCVLLPLRTVYVAPKPVLDKLRGHARADLRKLRNSDYRLVLNDGPVDYARVAELYRYVYLDRYGFMHHPRLGPAFFHHAHASGAFGLVGLVRGGRLDAFAMTLQVGDVVQVPFLGHDPAVARSEGLYRMAFAEVMRRAQASACSVNWSSGVGEFKVNRGCVAAREYVAVWSAHLDPSRRALVRLVGSGADRLLGGAAVH